MVITGQWLTKHLWKLIFICIGVGMSILAISSYMGLFNGIMGLIGLAVLLSPISIILIEQGLTKKV